MKIIRGVSGQTRHAQRIIAGNGNRLRGGVPFPSTNLNALDTSVGDILGLTADTRIQSNVSQSVYFSERVSMPCRPTLEGSCVSESSVHCICFAGHRCHSPSLPSRQQQLGHRHHHLPHNTSSAHGTCRMRVRAAWHHTPSWRATVQHQGAQLPHFGWRRHLSPHCDNPHCAAARPVAQCAVVLRWPCVACPAASYREWGTNSVVCGDQNEKQHRWCHFRGPHHNQQRTASAGGA